MPHVIRLETKTDRIVDAGGTDVVVSIVPGSGETPAEIKIRNPPSAAWRTYSVSTLAFPEPVPGDRDYRGPYIDAEDVCSAIMIDPRIPPETASTVSAIVREIATDSEYVARRVAMRTDPYDRKKSALFE